MAPVLTDSSKSIEGCDKYADIEGFNELYHELAKGIRSIKEGKVYTLEEAWKLIDKV